jgi:hypothetical protein
MRKLILLATFCFVALCALSQNGNFRSRASGNWNTNGSWERDANTDGIFEESPSSLIPNSNDGLITIRTGHNVTINSNIQIDQTVVESMALITVNPGGVLTVVNGSGVDLTNSGAVRTTTASQLVITANAEFEHQRNAGYIPTATWNDFSICSITGLTTGAPSNLNPPPAGFYHLNWNCPGQTKNLSMEGTFTIIRGDLNVINTNNFLFQLATNTIAGPVTIGGDLNVLTAGRIGLVNGANSTINVLGDFNFNSTNIKSSAIKDTGATVFNVAGDFNVNAPGGIFDFSTGTGTLTMNLSGNFNLIAGTVTETGASINTINFIGNGVQLFTNTGTITNGINYTVSDNSTLSLLNDSPVVGDTLRVNGQLMVGSLNATGAIVTGKVSGNVRTTARIYNPGSTVIYAGAGPQFIGNGHPVAAGTATEINNNSGVTFNTTTNGNSAATSLLIAGNLILTNGNLNIVSDAATRSLTLNGNVTANGNNITISGANSNLIINGSGAFGTFPFPSGSQSIRNFTLNRSGSGSAAFVNNLTVTGTTTITNGDISFGGTTTLTGTVSLNNGTRLIFDGQTLNINGNYTSTGGLLSGSTASTLVLNGSTVLSSPLAFSNPGNSINSLILNKTNGGVSAIINSPLTVTNALTLNDGQLDISGGALSLSGGATLTRSSVASISTSSPAGGPWNLIYEGGSLSTGLEIPSTGGVVESLTISSNNGSTITLGQSIVINSNFSNALAGRIFTCGSNSVTSGTITNGGTLNAPSTQLVLTGNFINNGTFNGNNGTVVVSGAVTMSGSTINATNFNNITINPAAVLIAPGTFNIQGNFTNDGTLVAGTGTVLMTGTAGLKTISGSSNTQFFNLLLNKSNSGVSVSVTSPQTVTSTLTLSDGELNVSSNTLSVSNNGTISRHSSASISGNSPTGGPWNLIYLGSSQTTGLEIPASGAVISLSANTSSGATLLSQNLDIQTSFTSLSTSTFSCSANNMAVGSFSNSGVFNAPNASASVGLTVSGNFNNSGTFNSAGTTVFDGSSTITGASALNFDDLVITGT